MFPNQIQGKLNLKKGNRRKVSYKTRVLKPIIDKCNILDLTANKNIFNSFDYLSKFYCRQGYLVIFMDSVY
jgi:hypothetical protein